MMANQGCPGGMVKCPHFRFAPESLENTNRAERAYETLQDSLSRSGRQRYEWRQCWMQGQYYGACNQFRTNSSCLRFLRSSQKLLVEALRAARGVVAADVAYIREGLPPSEAQRLTAPAPETKALAKIDAALRAAGEEVP